MKNETPKWTVLQEKEIKSDWAKFAQSMTYDEYSKMRWESYTSSDVQYLKESAVII